MNKIITLSAFAALSSALFFNPTAQACGGHEGKGGSLARMDANGDGKVTQQEMLVAWTARFDAADRNKDGEVADEERAAAHDAKMQEHLRAMDTNKNGSIEKAEARGPLARFFAEVDSDQSGALSQAEFAAHKKQHSNERGRVEDDRDDEPTTKSDLTAKLNAHFKRLDSNGDGALSGDELTRRGHHGHGDHHGDAPKDS